MPARTLLVGLLALSSHCAMAIDLHALWDFGKPAQSEQRFRAAMKDASPDDALILQTQIARSYGLRGDFAKAQQLLRDIEPRLAAASAQARARYFLELGRSYASAAHAPESQTDRSREQARSAYTHAIAVAKGAGLDDIRVDALHMLAFVDTAPSDQLKWTREALAVSEASTQEPAGRWAASLRNNIGYALHQQREYAAALAEFEAALRLRERQGDAEAIRVARWMVAWTLRALQRLDEAIAIQLQLEREHDAANAPSHYVYEELEELYRAQGNEALAVRYAERRKERAR